MKKTILLSLLVGALSLFAQTTSAQGTLKGAVLDADTKEPLIGANVVLGGTTIGTITDLNGQFSLTINPGDRKIIISYIGYITKELDVSIAEGQTKNVGEVMLESDAIGINEIMVLASFAKDRQTPVAMSQVDPLIIEEKLGSQEFPEILKTTPSIYATKDNGGFGDAKVRVRGFDTYNVGVLINGIPVNDMESSKVYWSNWAGLSDVSRTIQVQRGLGASKLGLSSVGGTINVITNSTDAKMGGSVSTMLGISGLRKQAFNISTGLLDNGWAITLSGAHTYGDGYIKGLNFDSYTYFANVSKRINDQHMLSLTVFGAKQNHNQRGNQHTIEQFRNHQDGIKFNSDYGIREGKPYGGAYGHNNYHKPQGSINHYWDINEKTLLSNVFYASSGRGFGRRVSGDQRNWLGVDYQTGLDEPEIKRTAQGLLDFDAVAEANKNSLEGSQAAIANAVNSHNWFGLLSTLTTNLAGINWTAGFDGRYYKGLHYYELDDLLGGEFFLNSDDINKPENTKLYKGDKLNYHNDGEVLWSGLFLQGEYVTNELSGFLSAAISNKEYRRIDYFQYTPVNQKTDWVNFTPWNIKGGVNYNINSNHNVLANAGYIKREPIFTNVFLNYTNEINEDVKYETVITTEIGYGYTSKTLNAKVNLYRTNWLDRALVQSLGQGGSANIPGINALHQGVEVEMIYRPMSTVTLKGMLSVGDWRWQDDVDFTQFDEDRNVIGTYNAYIGDIHVGNSAQTVAALILNWEILPKLRIGVDYTFFGENYADFEVTNRTKPEDKVDAWKMPDVGLVDMNMNYKFKIGNLDATLFGNINNLFNTEYVADATDGTDHDEKTSLVYFGFGITWSGGLKIHF